MKLIVIGTDSNANVRYNSQYVSGYHAEILLLDNGEIYLTDKGSRNGTFLNDHKLQPNKDILIKRGDAIRFADQSLDWRSIPVIPMPDMTKVKEMRGIGTNFRNKYQLQGERVSRFHATLKRMSDNKWYIQDHSRNGTTVNGRLIPPNQDVKLKRGDVISCAGVPVPNPYGKGRSFNYRRIISVISVLLLLCGGGYGLYRLIPGMNFNKEFKVKLGRTLSDKQISEKYENSVVLLIGSYHYRVSAGRLDLKKLQLPTDVIYLPHEKVIRPVDGHNVTGHTYTGTGFFISDDGKIVTNLHVVRPWLFDDAKSRIFDFYAITLSEMADEYDSKLGGFLQQLKVEGVLDYISMIPNGAYFSEDNMKECRELKAHDNIEKDVAILQLSSKKLPESVGCVVDMGQAVTDDSAIQLGAHIFTLGFPFGIDIQNPKSSDGLRVLANSGQINQKSGEYTFGFNAPASEGASGSPVFNEKGQLIGVLSSGVEISQGFNFAVKASHVVDLLNNPSSK